MPPHGRGRLAPKFEVGNPGNPGGRPAVLRDVQKLARKKSLDALHALIACYTTPDGKIARNVDGRIVVHAASTVLKWAFGEPPPYDPNADKPETKIDVSAVSLAERRRLLETMDREVTDAYRAAATDQHPVSDAVKSAGAEHRTLRRKFGAETDAMIRRLRQAVARTAGSAPGGTP